jgi:RND family efflux transporter MFP subunit
MRFVKTGAVLLLLLLAGWQGAVLYRAALAASRKPVHLATVNVERGDLALTLSGRGTLEAAHTFPLANQQVDTQIVEIVQDGVVVHKGDVVVRLDASRVEKELRDRKLADEEAKAQLLKVKADQLLNVKNASTTMTKATQQQDLLLSSNRAEQEQAEARVQFNRGELTYRQRDLVRTQGLAKDLLVPATKVEEADLNVKSREFELTQQERQLDSKHEQQRSAVTQGELLISDATYTATSAKNKANAQVANAEYNAAAARRLLELSETQLQWCTIPSPANGLTVLTRTWDQNLSTARPLRSGDPARPSMRFLDIIDLDRTRVVTSMSEIDLSQVKVGLPVRLWPRSAPDQVLKGRIASISGLARSGNMWSAGQVLGKKTFRVVIDLLESRPDLLRPGMTMDFEVLRGNVAKALRVPLQALFKTTHGTSVFIQQGGRFVARPVKLGAHNATYAAVVAGLKGGEKIALQRPPLELLGPAPPAALGARRSALRGDGSASAAQTGPPSTERRAPSAGDANPGFVPTTRAVQGAFDISLTIVGGLKAEESIPVAAESTGTVVACVDDGAFVKKGEIVVELQNDQLRLQLRQKRVEYVNAQSIVAETKRDRELEAANARTKRDKALEELAIMKQSNKAELDQAQAALDFQRTGLTLAKAQLGKDLRLAEERLVTALEVDQKREEVAAKEFAVKKAQAELELKRGQLASNENQKQSEVNHARFATEVAERRIADEIKNAEKNVQTKKKQLDDLQKQLDHSIVRAPADGVALLDQRWDGASGQRPLRPGDAVSPQRKLMDLPNLSKMIMTCDVEEKDIGLVRRGRPVKITLDSHPKVAYHGVVKDVALMAKPAAVEGGGWMPGKNSFSTVVTVKESDPEHLRPGMNATAEIFASTAKTATYIPLYALFTRREKPIVYRLRAGKFAAVSVETGARNKDYVVIRRGVNAGDTVALVVPPQKLISQ